MKRNQGPAGGVEPPLDGYWFNTKTLKVEKGLLTAAPFRIGPFATQQEASNALAIISARAKAWQSDDEANR